jgi:hypothetical protein
MQANYKWHGFTSLIHRLTQNSMERSKRNHTVASVTSNQKIQRPVPPQVEYPLEKPDSKKNQKTKPGNSSTKK